MSYNKVSIIIPTKNNGDILEKCLVSIKNLDYPREGESESTLHSFSDGWRHLKHILLRAPTLLFLIPGFILFALGMLLVFLIWNPFNLWVPIFGIHSMIAGCLLAIQPF
jgi:hypothetical protein